MNVLVIPLEAKFLRQIPEKLGRIVVGALIVALGCLTLGKVISQL